MENLNSPFFQKPYSRAADLPRLIELVKTRSKERLADFPSIADLQEMLGADNPQNKLRLWEDASGKLAGFALLQDYKTWYFLVMEVSPACPVRDIEEQLLAWAEEIVHIAVKEHHAPLPLEVHVKAEETLRIAVLEAFGFERLPGGSVSFWRSLRKPIPNPSLPSGFTIRPSAGEAEAEEWVRLHRLAWNTENMTVERRLSMMRAPFYDPSLDLVAVAPDGSLAAYCVCWFSTEENDLTGHKDGHTDPLATHPAYQRHGLARALMLTGLRLLKERGIETARMGTAQENTAMIRASEGVGFRIDSETLWYSKVIV